jgi:hypothetical protein
MVREFHSYMDFHRFMTHSYNSFNLNASVRAFRSIANNVPMGCKCSIEKRKKRANTYYQKLNFSWEDQQNLKVLANATEIKFYFEGNLFLEF